MPLSPGAIHMSGRDCTCRRAITPHHQCFGLRLTLMTAGQPNNGDFRPTGAGSPDIAPQES